MRKQIFTVLFVSLFLVADKTYARKFKFNPEYLNYKPNITVIPSENHLDFTKAVGPYLTMGDRLELDKLMGFTVIVKHSRQCFVFVVQPRREKDFINWGHELAHCVYGRYHTKLPANVKVFD